MGGKTRTDSTGKVSEGWDHDPPAKQKQVPFGILMLASGALTLLFGTKETSDAWVDALMAWWELVRSDQGHVERLVIYQSANGTIRFRDCVLRPESFGPSSR